MKKSELRQIIKEEIKNILEYTWNKQNYLRYIKWAQKKKLDPFSQDTVDAWKNLNENEINELDGKQDKGTNLWAQTTKPKIFDVDNVKEVIKKMNVHIKAPYVGVQYSDLGGPQHVGIYLLISLDSKNDWPNNIIENSRYFRMSLSNEGKLELFSGGFHPQLKPYKFRKAQVKSVDNAIKKINDFIALASKGDK